MVKVEMTKHPSEEDWFEVKRRALVTVGKKPVNKPTEEWKKQILRARHSPIRHLMFSFDIECPYWVSVHLSRHVHAQPYVKSQRNDRQSDYDRNAARQDEMVNMIWDMNAEELMIIAGKRLCNQASRETRDVVLKMCLLVLESHPEFGGLLEPICVREGKCNEMYPCGKGIMGKKGYQRGLNDAVDECIKIADETCWRDSEMLIEYFKEYNEKINE